MTLALPRRRRVQSLGDLLAIGTGSLGYISRSVAGFLCLLEDRAVLCVSTALQRLMRHPRGACCQKGRQWCLSVMQIQRRGRERFPKDPRWWREPFASALEAAKKVWFCVDEHGKRVVPHRHGSRRVAWDYFLECDSHPVMDLIDHDIELTDVDALLSSRLSDRVRVLRVDKAYASDVFAARNLFTTVFMSRVENLSISAEWLPALLKLIPRDPGQTTPALVQSLKCLSVNEIDSDSITVLCSLTCAFAKHTGRQIQTLHLNSNRIAFGSTKFALRSLLLATKQQPLDVKRFITPCSFGQQGESIADMFNGIRHTAQFSGLQHLEFHCDPVQLLLMLPQKPSYTLEGLRTLVLGPAGDRWQQLMSSAEVYNTMERVRQSMRLMTGLKQLTCFPSQTDERLFLEFLQDTPPKLEALRIKSTQDDCPVCLERPECRVRATQLTPLLLARHELWNKIAAIPTLVALELAPSPCWFRDMLAPFADPKTHKLKHLLSLQVPCLALLPWEVVRANDCIGYSTSPVYNTRIKLV